MFKLNLPTYNFKLREENSRQFIFDSIRKKYVSLTPEEWVRQNIIAWLIHEKNYPAGLIAIEKEIRVNKLKKRFDIVVFGKDSLPALLIECKAPSVKITQETFDQAARYNLALKVSRLAVTNGLEHYCCHIDLLKGTFSFLDEFPDYDKLL